jgi:tetratricopeptide (TPR) repeat protein
MLPADMSDQPPARRVMISSTALDLPEHRKHARDACERMSMLPLVMEQMPASPLDALTLSRQYVDKADYYLGIFAFRYGTILEREDKSITELEYDRAIERKIPVFIFIADDKHPVSFRDVERGAGAPKLEAFKERLKKCHVVRTFRSSEELRTEIIHAFSEHREDDAAKLHYIAEIPPPPEPWIAHWYSLLGGRRLVGRREELNRLTDWIANPSSEAYSARLFALVAIGGMGKTALAWTWFNEVAPHEMKPLAGRVWWSFYESDARLENFTARALAYLTGKPRASTEQIPRRDREDQLLAVLDRDPYLIVLDGVERELVAYARMDAAHISEDDLDAKTAHQFAHRAALTGPAAQSTVGEAKLRRTADPRTGQFLRRLTQIRAARILVTTRLLPYELQDFNGELLSGTAATFLRGLSDDDAVALWRSAGINGARDTLVTLFRIVDGHPLLVQALAGVIARDRRSPGDFDKWRKRHPNFNPFDLPLVQRKSHVIEYALQGLASRELALLRAIAAFRMPAAYETLVALLVGPDDFSGLRARLLGLDTVWRRFATEEALDRALSDLENRGLVGWDRRANRYDLHPVVRGVVWSGVGESDRDKVAERMRAHFTSMPTFNWNRPERLEDATPAIELYVSLTRLGRFDEAFDVLQNRLQLPLSFWRAVPYQCVELVEMMFPDGVDCSPRLNSPRDRIEAFHLLACSYHSLGQPGRALPSYRQAAADSEEHEGRLKIGFRLGNLRAALLVTGAIRAAASCVSRAFAHRYDDSKFNLSPAIARLNIVRDVSGGYLQLRRAFSFYDEGRVREHVMADETLSRILAQAALWFGQAVTAHQFAARACKLSSRDSEKDSSHDARMLGEAALALGDLEHAEKRLNYALTEDRAVHNVDGELPTLTALAALNHRRGDGARAREHLDAVWERAERGPYPLCHADARNVLAEIEIAENNPTAAVAAATFAYRLAWCDGPPFAYDFGLTTARGHLRALGASEPAMPPYDASKHEPLKDMVLKSEDFWPAD